MNPLWPTESKISNPSRVESLPCAYPHGVWLNGFGVDMTEELFVGPCFGIVPLGAAVGVLLAHFSMSKFDRR